MATTIFCFGRIRKLKHVSFIVDLMVRLNFQFYLTQSFFSYKLNISGCKLLIQYDLPFLFRGPIFNSQGMLFPRGTLWSAFSLLPSVWYYIYIETYTF